MVFEFREPKLGDRDLIEGYFKIGGSRSCEYSFTNLYLWKRFYPVTFAIIHDMLVIRSEGPNHSYWFPQGNTENLDKVIPELEQIAKEEGHPFKLILVTPEEFEKLEAVYPGRFQIEYERHLADYIYETEKLAKLSGKKYHGQKNHLNKFKKTYTDWQYEPITDENRDECFQMELRWRNIQGYDDNVDEELHAELGVTMNAVRLLKELHLTGGALRVNGEIVAFTIGEALNEDTFVAHIEKAMPNVESAYTMINQQFVEHEMGAYTYVNREDDAGQEGLRRAKESYHPVMMIEKGIVTVKA